LVPEFKSYLIIGNGRAAKHLVHYFQLLSSQIPFYRWYRDPSDFNNSKMLDFMLAQASHVILAISDSEIASFVEKTPALEGKCLIHLSGALEVRGVFAAHPLMTFTNELYDFDVYKKMAFVLSAGSPPFSQLFPHLGNANYEIPVDKKALYHALCVLSGNFTSLLWKKTFSEFESQLSLPKEILFPYLQQISANLQKNSGDALTGPLARRDFATIDKNLEALQGDPFRFVYQAFVTATLNASGGPK
ncbi:MAG: DUF2520 domain-containing protein, partial [Pseudobdellovibrionaceae bacterium]